MQFLIACIILAVGDIHSIGVFHRDLKPENCAFDEKGYLRLFDFGIARIKGDDLREEWSGTLLYMAPEVLFK